MSETISNIISVMATVFELENIADDAIAKEIPFITMIVSFLSIVLLLKKSKFFNNHRPR